MSRRARRRDASARPAFDAVTLEVCWNRLIGVVNEQAAALQRTSFSSVVRGGEAGAPGEVWIDGARPANPKAEQTLTPESRVELRLPGGGGYGDPAARDPDLSRRDVEHRYVSPG